MSSATSPIASRLIGLAAHSRWEQLAEQCREFKPRIAVVCDPDVLSRSSIARSSRVKPNSWAGRMASPDWCSHPDVDVVLSAIVGAAGLDGTWAALEAGKTVALANKETLVVAGPLVTDLAARRGAELLPVDSEHSAIFQALMGHSAADVTARRPDRQRRPVSRQDRGRTGDRSRAEQALRHPTWQMGPKITVDSATLMNKALEVIEARWLFGLAAEQIEVIIHPESIVHSFVEFVDGSVLAQLSPPDMRLPIQRPDLSRARGRAGEEARLANPSPRSTSSRPTARPSRPSISASRSPAAAGPAARCSTPRTRPRSAVPRTATCRSSTSPGAAAAMLDAHDFDPRPTLARLLALDRWARQEVGRWIRTRTQAIPSR